MVFKYGLEITENKIPKLVKESSFFTNPETVESPEKVMQLLNNCLRLKSKAEEHFCMIAVDTKCVPIGIFVVSQGDINSSLTNIRGIFIRALACGASGIILAHNHPSQNTTPSEDDINVCRKLIEAGKMLEISVLDFIIIGNGFFSFRKEGVCFPK